MKLSRRHIRLGGVVLIVLAIAALGLWPETIQVDLAGIERGPMEVTIDEEGETRVRERFVISAPVAGRLERIELEPGDPVARGAIVARLTPAQSALLDARERAEAEAALETARASVGQAGAERSRAAAALERAQSSLERQRDLAEAGVVSRDDLESAETAVKTAEETLRAAEFAVTRAEYALQEARVRLRVPAAGGRPVDIAAPADGVVLKRARESESVVPAGETLLEIGDPSLLEIVSDLLSTDAVKVSPGSPVWIEQWGGGQTLEASVRRVEPSGFMKVSALGVEEQRVNVVMDFANPESAARALGDAYRVEVRVVVWQKDDVLKAPVGSLFRRGDGWAAFVVEEGRARLHVVELGQRNDRWGEILKGLEAGQTVVVHPPDTLTDGARVEPRPSS